MKIKLIVLFFLTVLFYSCKKNEKAIDSFTVVEKELNYTLLYSDEGDNLLLGQVSDMLMYDNKIVVKQNSGSNIFLFLDGNTGQLLQRWGEVGQGPGEYSSISNRFTIVDSSLVFLDNQRKEINYVSIPDILFDNNRVFVKKENYPYTVNFRPKQISILDSSKIFIGSFDKGRFGLLNSRGDIDSCLFDYPFNYEQVKGIYRGSIFQSDIKNSQKQGKFVISTFCSDIFEIYELKNNIIKRVFLSPFNNKPIIWKKRNRFTIDYKQSIAGFMDMSVSDDFIFLSYSKLNYEEAAASRKEPNIILCFNWNGEKVKKYVLPFSIDDFCVDESHIYVLTSDINKTSIYKVDL